MQKVRDYYFGKTLLVTGATGFVGKALIEAILDRLPGVRRLYLLIRPRTDGAGQPRSPADALHEEILASSAFDSLRARHGADFDALARDRLEAVAGDLGEHRLGMDAATWRRLGDEVDVIINSGAVAVFDAPLDQAVQINTLGPQRLLEFAREAARRPFMAHVSTCYVNNLAGPVFETPLDPCSTPRTMASGEPFDVDEEVRAILARVAHIRDGAGAAPGLLVAEGLAWARRRGWHDTYTFTKAMGEQLLSRYQDGVPAMILRPSIIESALRSPAPGWIEGFRMIDPLIVGFARGQIFEFPGNPETVLDVVPADVVVNALLAAIPQAHAEGEPRIFQVASGMDSPLRVKEFHGHLVDYFERAPLRKRGQGPALPRLSFPDTGRFLRRLDRRYLLPLRVLQALWHPLRFSRRVKRRLAHLGAQRSRLERLRHFAEIYGPYAQIQAHFLSCNVKALWQRLDPDDRASFPFAIEGFDWQRYLQETHIPGIEHYLLHMARATPRDISLPPETAAPAAAGASAGGDRVQWRTPERLVALTRRPRQGRVADWTTPAHKKLLHRANLRLMRFISRHYLDLQASGLEHLPARGPFILVSNHCSHVDTGLLLSALDGQAPTVHPTAAGDYWFRSSIVAWLLHGLLGAVPFDRQARNVPKALALPAEVLRNSHSVIFYPEGTRSPDGRLRRFKGTVGLLALASGAPLVPAHITGSHRVLPKGKRFLRRHPVTVRFGPLVRIEPYLCRLQHEQMATVARRLAADVQGAVEELAAAGQATGRPA